MATCETPPRASRRGRIVLSAMVLRSMSDVESAVRPIIMISPRIDDCGPSVGVPTPGGRVPSRPAMRSETICRARYMSVPQSNSTHTAEKPVVEVERTRRTPVEPLTEVSIGYVTSFSTSSGAMPGASVMTTTVGALRSGKISTSLRRRMTVPKTSTRTMRMTTVSRLLSEKRIILLSIAVELTSVNAEISRSMVVRMTFGYNA